MKQNRLLKTLVCLSVILTLILLIKANVTFSKEPLGKQNTTVKILEKNSELVQKLYTKLTLLEDTLQNPNYKYAYYTMKDKEKELSPEEKFYITIENMYQNGIFDLEKVDDNLEKVTISTDQIIDETKKMFKDNNIDAKKINFQPSSECGIVGYLFTGKDYELTFKKCTKSQEIRKTELKSAKKDGNYVILRLKAFYATYQKKTKKEKEDYYIIRNYNSEKKIAQIEANSIFEKIDLITETYPIDDYDFYFELRGEDYYLTKIARVPATE